MLIEGKTDERDDQWEALHEDLIDEIGTVVEKLNEIKLLLEQSQLEVKKLAQRNVSVSSSLQQIQNQFDTIPREDIRDSYDTALDIQQRLFVMRGQLEKLQSDREHLEQYLHHLERVAEVMKGGKSSSQKPGLAQGYESLEAIIQAQEAERQRLSRQMHDGPAQALSNFILQTEIALRLFDVNPNQARDELGNLKESASDTFQKVRDFIFELRPMMLDDLGLTPTIKRYLEAFKDQIGIETRLSVTGVDRRLESYIEVLIFRAIQELLGKAVRESRANQVELRIDFSDNSIRVIIEDNGKGFDEETLKNTNKVGVQVIKERVEMLGGYLSVDSILGQGTSVTFQIPTGKSGQPVFA
jgi:two-component system sensor histidine kinase DegS